MRIVLLAAAPFFSGGVMVSVGIADPQALKAVPFSPLGIKGKGNTAKARVNGKACTFLFDTKGNEALVVYRN